MSFTHFLATRLGLPTRPASRRKTAAARPRFRPMLEALEDRWVPSTLTVTSAADSGAGSLRAEIKAAHRGDTIVFSPTLDGQTIMLTEGELLINKSLTITGPGAGLLTISGNNASTVFAVASGVTDTLSGMAINNGKGGSSGGGGILNSGTLTVNNCSLSNNTVSGIVNEAGAALTLNDCVLSGNSGNNGGAIINYGKATLTDSTLSQNTAKIWGGGIYNGGSLTISGSTLLDNSAPTGGGGIWCQGGTATVSGSSLLGNSADEGGAIFSQGNTTVTIEDSTLSGNRATNGGAIYIYSGNLTVDGSTVGGSSPTDANVASSAGGGIYVNKYATVTVENYSTIINNTAPAGYGPDVYNLGTLYLDSTSTIGDLDGNHAQPM